MISCRMFFFNRKMTCSSSISTFIASASNLIMKSAVFHFPCLNISIFHSAFAVLDLSLNVVLISFTKSSQSWVPSSLSSSSSFFCVYIPATPLLKRARIAVILSSVSRTLLLLRNNHIPLHQSSNFIQSPSNHPGSSTIFFGIPTCTFLLIPAVAGAGADEISISIHSSLLEASSVICKDSSHSDNASISFVLLKLILVSLCSLHYTCFVPNR